MSGLDRYQKRYGESRLSHGFPPDFTKCAKHVYSADGWRSWQCSRQRGHGPDEAYCKQHAKAFGNSGK